MRVKCSTRLSLNAKRFGAGQWSFLGPGSEKIGILSVKRSTSPLSRGVLKSKGGGQLSIHSCADPGTIETVFRTIIYVNQLSIYGAVADICEECDVTLAMIEQGDLLWKDNLTHCSCQV